MRIKSVLLSFSVLAALAGLNADLAHANLIVNGNFEQTTNGGNKRLAASPTTVADRTTLTGWTSSNGTDGGYNFVLNGAGATSASSVLRLRGDNNGYVTSPNGGNIFASDPMYYPGTLSQTIGGLSVGSTYLLTFDYALAQQTNYTGPNSDFWQVSFGKDTQQSSTLTIADGGFSGWKTASMLFTAGSVSQVLSFLAVASSPGAPPFMLLDSVAMNPSSKVPEPSTLSLLLGGFGVAGLVAYRRRSRKQA
jgi:hypothetical protein